MSSAYSAPVWLFNVENTLATPKEDNEQFLRGLGRFATRNDVRLVSSLDYQAVCALAGPLLPVTRACYASHGNSVWVRGEKLHEPVFEAPHGLLAFLRRQANESLYPVAHDTDICAEHGVLKLRVLGRYCSAAEAEDYAEWDAAYEERRSWARAIASAYPSLEAMPVGQHCVNVYPVDCGLEQVLEHIRNPVVVIGHCMDPRSAEFRLGRAALERRDGSQAFHSDSWETTFALLQSLRVSGFGGFA